MICEKYPDLTVDRAPYDPADEERGIQVLLVGRAGRNVQKRVEIEEQLMQSMQCEALQNHVANEIVNAYEELCGIARWRNL